VSGLAFPLIANHDAIAAGHVLSLDENGVPSSAQECARRKRFSNTRNIVDASEFAFYSATPGTSEQDDDAFIAYGIKQAESQRQHALAVRRRREKDKHLRRCRTSKRDIARVDMESLVKEAMAMFDRLMKHESPRASDQKGLPAKRLAYENNDGASAPGGVDIREYVEWCHSHGEDVDLEKVHGMLRQHDATMLMKKRRNLMQHEYAKHTHWYRSLREHISRLAVCLWKCAVTSPYMSTEKRASDNFRPFVAGVFFSIKRGVKLKNGVVIIPRCLAIASALPQTRVTSRHSIKHQLHLSAHRGVCTLHKCIRSVCGDDEPTVFFGDAIHLARVLYEIDRIKSR